MEQLLKVGSVVRGQRGRYQVRQLRLPSQTCVSYLCQAENGAPVRLEHYQSGCPMGGEARRRFLALPPLPGVLLPTDHGRALGLDFDVFPEAGGDLAARNIGLMELIGSVIPQLNHGLLQLHRAGLLLRDIRPGTVFYDPAARRGWLTGFANLAALGRGATATRAEGGNIPAFCYPPEYRSMGWSIYSDYYALGLTLLQCLKGARLFDGLQPGQIWEQVRGGRLPGVDRAQLTRTAYQLLSAEQKALYLVLGLTLPDPHQRWGFGEVRAWCAGQALALVQTGEKVRYQMSVPFPVAGTPCWDYPQLALALAKSGAEGEGLLPGLAKHLERQNPTLAGRIREILADRERSAPGRLFYTVYTLSPALSGFWWRGTCYQTSAELAQAARARKDALDFLGQMLRDRCFSFLTRLRGGKSGAQRQELARFERLEAWEREERGKGASRFLMQMAGGQGQRFSLDGRSYAALEELLDSYEQRGAQLKARSAALLRDRMFQGWMWAKGLGEAAAAAARRAEEEVGEAFYLLLRLCEEQCSEPGKRASRRMYLRWGPCAELTWLREHLEWYESEDGARAGLVRQLETARWSEEVPLEELRQNEEALLISYQNFVRNTETNPLKLAAGVPAGEDRLFRPTRAEAFFCCKWEQAEVTPDFLRWIGEAVPAQEAERWCEAGYAAVEEWIEREETAVQSISGFTRGVSGDGAQAAGTAGIVLWFLFPAVCLAAAALLFGFVPLTLLCALAALWFPVQAAIWSLTVRRRQALRRGELAHFNRRLDELDRRRGAARRWREDISRALRDGTGLALRRQTWMDPLGDPQSIEPVRNVMEGGSYRLSLVLSNTALLLMPLVAGMDLRICGGGAVYGILASLLLSRRLRTPDEAILPLLFVQISGWILYAVFLRWPAAGVLAALAALYWLRRK